MDLALNNLQMLMCHKTQPTNQPTIFFSMKLFEIMKILMYSMNDIS